MTSITSKPPFRWITYKVRPEEAGQTIEDILNGPLEISKRMIQRLTRSQGIKVNNKPTFLARQVKVGDVISVRVADSKITALDPVPMDLDIVYEDQEILVINKPADLLVHPTAQHQTVTLAHGIAHYYQTQGMLTKICPVHRLDRDTSGLVLIAKSSFVHQKLDRLLKARKLKREYLALVAGIITEDGGKIDLPIVQHDRIPYLRTVGKDLEKFALTHYRVLERYKEATLVHITLETGRTHQIRVHMAHIGHPLIGDRHYHSRNDPRAERLALHAWKLSFVHPTTGRLLSLEAPIPQALEWLKKTFQESTGPQSA